MRHRRGVRGGGGVGGAGGGGGGVGGCGGARGRCSWRRGLSLVVEALKLVMADLRVDDVDGVVLERLVRADPERARRGLRPVPGRPVRPSHRQDERGAIVAGGGDRRRPRTTRLGQSHNHRRSPAGPGRAGLPFVPIEFEALTVTPYVKGNGRLAYSLSRRHAHPRPAAVPRPRTPLRTRRGTLRDGAWTTPQARSRARVSALSLPVDARSAVECRTFRSRPPLLSVAVGRMLVTLTLPGRPRAEDVEFARRPAEQSVAYALEVERRYRGCVCPPVRQVDLGALPVGRRDDRQAWRLRLLGTHVLIAGATGPAKAPSCGPRFGRCSRPCPGLPTRPPRT
jgi:hypothetical protein